MAKSKNSSGKKNQRPARQQPRAQQVSTQRSGPSVLTPPLVNLASNAGRQSEIALPVRKGLSTLTIHPDNTRWLGEAAPSFQRWGMADLTLWYEPRVATSTNGQIALAFLSDFADQSPGSLEDTVTLAGAQRGAPWSRFQMGKQRNRLFDYCSLSDFAQGDATTMNDRSPGRIVVWADMDSSFSSDDVVGWVYISYKPVLQQPILRKMQLGGADGGGGGTSPPINYPVPNVPNKSGYRLADYYYQERAYTTAYDFLGLNPNYNDEVYQLTPRVGYIYTDKLGYNAVVNTSSDTVRVYFDIILRDFSIFSTPQALTFKTWGTTLFGGNKGHYTAWANGDVSIRIVGDIEPNGWFYYDNSILTSWSTSEVFIFELGLENGHYIPPLKLPDFDWGAASAAVSLVPEVAATSAQRKAQSLTYTLGPSIRNADYVGVSGAGGSILDGITLLVNSDALAARLGLAKPANQLAVAIRNDRGSDVYLHVMLFLSGFNTSYATTPVNAITNNGTVYDNATGSPMNAYTVKLGSGASVTWNLALRSSSYNGATAVESLGNVCLAVVATSELWPSTIA